MGLSVFSHSQHLVLLHQDEKGTIITGIILVNNSAPCGEVGRLKYNFSIVRDGQLENHHTHHVLCSKITFDKKNNSCCNHCVHLRKILANRKS